MGPGAATTASARKLCERGRKRRLFVVSGLLLSPSKRGDLASLSLPQVKCNLMQALGDAQGKLRRTACDFCQNAGSAERAHALERGWVREPGAKRDQPAADARWLGAGWMGRLEANAQSGQPSRSRSPMRAHRPGRGCERTSARLHAARCSPGPADPSKPARPRAHTPRAGRPPRIGRPGTRGAPGTQGAPAQGRC